MPSKLMAARYEGLAAGKSAYDDITPTEALGDVSELGVKWGMPGGLQRIELTVKARSRYDAYARYKGHLGQRIAVYDSFCDRYLGGQIYEIIPDGWHVTYVCGTDWKRTYDDFYNVSDFPGAGDTDVIIKDILTDSVSIASADQTNIAGSGVAIGGWIPDHTPGTYPGNAIAELANVGHSTAAQMDFYFVDQPFLGARMQAPKPYFKARSTTADPDWIFSIEDLAPNGVTMARNIWNLKTLVWIAYGRLSGTCDAGSGATLIDAGNNFITSGVRPGDRVVNVTDNLVFEVAAVDDANTLSFTDTTATNWAVTEVYSIKLRDPIWTAGSAESSDYWSVRYREIRPELDQVQAEIYRDQLADTFSAPILQQAFVISSPTIKDTIGAKWPLWRPLMGDSFYFRVSDIFPEAAIFGTSDNREQTFMAVAMDYTYSNNRLRVVPSMPDSRLDAILNQAGLINAQMISTEAAGRAYKREESLGWGSHSVLARSYGGYVEHN